MKKTNIPKAKSSINGAIWMFAGSSLQIICQIAILAVLARLLTPEDFGIVSIILILVNFSTIFTDMGVGAALVQMKDITKTHISTGYTLSILIGVLIGVLFYFFAPYIGRFFEADNLDKPIRFFSFFFIIFSFNSISESILQRKLKFPQRVKARTFSYIFGYGVFSVILALLGFGYWSLIYGQLAQLIIYTLILMYFEKPTFTFSIHKSTIKQLMFFGSGHTIATLFNYLANTADNLIVAKILNVNSLGLYSRAYQLLAIPASFFGTIYDKIFFPILSSKQDDIKILKDFYLFSMSLCFGVLVPFTLISILNAELIIKVLLGDQWLEAIVIFQILLIGLSFRFATRINKSYLKSLGYVYEGALYQFVFAILMVGFCLLGVTYFDLTGLAVGVVFAMFLNYIQISIKLKKIMKFSSRFFIRLHIISVVFILPVILVYLILFYFNLNTSLIILLFSIFIFIPFIILMFFNKNNVIFNDNNQNLIEQVLENLPSSITKILSKFKFLKKYMKG
ncbi:MAG: lipopolysaccharide biosynthesis protein [Arcobacter sp.]|nr:lipopolysaccharide biosynthesis protein [Arcobacter sp.]